MARIVKVRLPGYSGAVEAQILYLDHRYTIIAIDQWSGAYWVRNEEKGTWNQYDFPHQAWKELSDDYPNRYDEYLWWDYMNKADFKELGKYGYWQEHPKRVVAWK